MAEYKGVGNASFRRLTQTVEKSVASFKELLSSKDGVPDVLQRHLGVAIGPNHIFSAADRAWNVAWAHLANAGWVRSMKISPTSQDLAPSDTTVDLRNKMSRSALIRRYCDDMDSMNIAFRAPEMTEEEFLRFERHIKDRFEEKDIDLVMADKATIVRSQVYQARSTRTLTVRQLARLGLDPQQEGRRYPHADYWARPVIEIALAALLFVQGGHKGKYITPRSFAGLPDVAQPQQEESIAQQQQENGVTKPRRKQDAQPWRRAYVT